MWAFVIFILNTPESPDLLQGRSSAEDIFSSVISKVLPGGLLVAINNG